MESRVLPPAKQWLFCRAWYLFGSVTYEQVNTYLEQNFSMFSLTDHLSGIPYYCLNNETWHLPYILISWEKVNKVAWGDSNHLGLWWQWQWASTGHQMLGVGVAGREWLPVCVFLGICSIGLRHLLLVMPLSLLYSILVCVRGRGWPQRGADFSALLHLCTCFCWNLNGLKKLHLANV